MPAQLASRRIAEMIQNSPARARAALATRSSTMDPGVVYVVATPIGHLDDISARALDALRRVDVVAAEDTRRTRQLLSHFGIDRPLVSCHGHNEGRASERLLQELRQGRSVALVSDAGTPCLSDPGQALVDACHEAGVRVIPIPGASAITAALSVAGLDNSRFVFEGFIPRDGRVRRELLSSWRSASHAVVLFEAANRMVDTVDEMIAAIGGERRLLVARELTKLHEQVLRACLAEVRHALASGTVPLLGEFVLVLEPAPRSAQPALPPLDAETVLVACLEYLSPSQASRLAARLTGRPRSEIYALGQQLAARPGASRPDGMTDAGSAGATE
jgi:16S rRNA (cytidine1402-2'-O)-methyltransferase